MVLKLCGLTPRGAMKIQVPVMFQVFAYIRQWNLPSMDIKGTEPSVCILEV